MTTRRGFLAGAAAGAAAVGLPLLLKFRGSPADISGAPDPDKPLTTPRLYAAMKTETSVYLDCLRSGTAPRQWKVDTGEHPAVMMSARGMLQEERWVTPAFGPFAPAAPFGPVKLEFRCCNPDTLAVLGTDHYSLKVVDPAATGGRTLKVLVIGDSNTHYGRAARRLSERCVAFLEGFQVTLLGTVLSFETPGVRMEGHDSWSYSTLLQPAFTVPANFAPDDGTEYSAAHYLAHNSIGTPDLVIWAFGTNDVFSATDRASARAEALKAVLSLEKLIGIVPAPRVAPWSAVGAIPHLVSLPPMPASQDAAGAAYGILQTRAQFRENLAVLDAEMIDRMRGREADRVFLAPTNVCVDTRHGYPFAGPASYSIDATAAVRRNSDFLHPIVIGTAATILSRTRSGHIATLSTDTAHGLSAGSIATVANVGGTGYDGTVLVTGVPEPTSFTYVSRAADEVRVSGLGGSLIWYHGGAEQIGDCWYSTIAGLIVDGKI